MSEWYPIQTAPRDGTTILLYATRHNMLVADPIRVIGHYNMGWWGGGSTLSHATHWMPLPSPPQSGA